MTVPVLTRGVYKLDGRTLPRVSSILAMMPKDGIWTAKLKMAAETGDAHAADKAWEPARDLGTAIHKATEAWDRDAELPADEMLRPYVDAYRIWRAQYVADVVEIERIVWSPTLHVAGTLDRVYRMRDNRLVLADVKSGKTVDGTTRLQTIGYAGMLEENTGIRVDGRCVVHLPSNRPGTVQVIEYDDDAGDMLTWRCLCRLYHWWQLHSADWEATR